MSPMPGAVCSICFTLVKAEGLNHVCEGCNAVSHLACHEFLGGCAMYGCARMVEVTKHEHEGRPVVPLASKTCPMCAEAIFEESATCPYCDSRLSESAPPDVENRAREPSLPTKVIVIGLGTALCLLGGGALLFWLLQAAVALPEVTQ